MKKTLLFSAMLVVSLSVHSQCVDPMISDFECSAPSHPFTGNGIATIDNLYSGGINTSAHIGEYTDNGTDGWDNLQVDYESVIDLSTHNILRFKLYTSKSIQILAKIEGGTTNPKEAWSDYSQIDQWQELLLDFSSAASDGNTKLILFFNADKTDGTTTDKYYIDDLEWVSQADLSNNDIRIISDVNIYPNPSKSFINISSTQKFTKAEIYNSIGQIVKSIEANNLKRIDISNLTSSIYTLKLYGNKVISVRKLIVE